MQTREPDTRTGITAEGTGVGPSSTYRERLTIPWWWWPLALPLAALTGAPVATAVPTPVLVVLALPVVVVAGGLWWLGRIPVTVTGDELQVDDARLPLRYVADAIPLDASGRQELLGPSADPLAFVIQRPWIPGAVQVLLDDPDDPTPYWVISSRRPEELAAALLRQR
jgi:hypothetical protein